MARSLKLVVLAASPHAGGAGSRLAQVAVAAAQDAGMSARLLRLNRYTVAPCDNCGACLGTGQCCHVDDFEALVDVLDEADALMLVSPVYFAGPPAQLKAFFDRYQARWVRRYVLGQPACQKRPALLAVTRTGQDPFGFDPLVTITRSALNIAGFSLGRVEDFKGYGGDAARNGTPTEEQAVAQRQVDAEAERRALGIPLYLASLARKEGLL